LENFSVSYGTVENRGEIITRGADFHLYGSHNIDGLRKLIQFLQSDHYTFSRINFDSAIVSFSSRSSRDLVVMLRMLKNSGLPEIVVTSFVHPKACPREVLARLCHQEGLRFVEDISAIIHQKSSGRVLVSGSYYFLSFIRSCLGQ
jgi:folylpolyglutamate synthase/dihydropteroate synthase